MSNWIHSLSSKEKNFCATMGGSKGVIPLLQLDSCGLHGCYPPLAHHRHCTLDSQRLAISTLPIWKVSDYAQVAAWRFWLFVALVVSTSSPSHSMLNLTPMAAIGESQFHQKNSPMDVASQASASLSSTSSLSAIGAIQCRIVVGSYWFNSSYFCPLSKLQ